MIELSQVQEIAARLSRASGEVEAFRVLEEASRRHFEHILFTVLRFDYERKEMRRLFSNREDVSPAGGAKPFPSGPWADLIVDQGKCYVGYSKEDLKEVFFDHEELWAIGCESVMNVPVIWAGRTLGSFNVLGRAGQYDPSKAAVMGLIGQLAAPSFLTAPAAANAAPS